MRARARPRPRSHVCACLSYLPESGETEKTRDYYCLLNVLDEFSTEKFSENSPFLRAAGGSDFFSVAGEPAAGWRSRWDRSASSARRLSALVIAITHDHSKRMWFPFDPTEGFEIERVGGNPADPGDVVRSEAVGVLFFYEQVLVAEDLGDLGSLHGFPGGFMEPVFGDVDGLVVVPADRLSIVDAVARIDIFDRDVQAFCDPGLQLRDNLRLGVEDFGVG